MANATVDIYRIEDGSPVVVATATTKWVAAARPALRAVAKKYDTTTTYQALADAVQSASGIATRVPVPEWIGGILEAVAADCHKRGEPLLTALCVHTDGTISDAYASSVANTHGTEITSDTALEAHAAQERLKCYQHFGAKMPAAAGAPVVPKRAAPKRARTVRGYVAPRSCPVCSMVLPSSGRCVNCRAGQ